MAHLELISFSTSAFNESDGVLLSVDNEGRADILCLDDMVIYHGYECDLEYLNETIEHEEIALRAA